ARDPVAEHLRDAVRAARMERRRLALRRLRHLAEHLARAGLVEATPDALLADRVQQPLGSHPGRIGRVLRDVEADPYMALRAKVVDLIRTDPAHQLVERRPVAQISEHQLQLTEDVIDPRRVERTRAAKQAEHLVILLQQDLRQIGAILARDPGDERLPLRHGALPYRGGRLRLRPCASSSPAAAGSSDRTSWSA